MIKGNEGWSKAYRCEWNLSDFEEEIFTIIDELLNHESDEVGMDYAVMEKYMDLGGSRN